jgi:predicted XRE-type DNA-binding protein
MAYVYNNIDDRIKNYVRKTRSCWIWIGYKNELGYGRITIGHGKQVKAHRFIYEQTYGKIPDGMNALHKCDNPSCVNPRHIYLGTQKDNVRDMMKRKRGGYKVFCGESHWNRKLDMEKVELIKKLWQEGELFQREIGEKVGISQQVVSKVINGKAWTKNGSQVISNKKYYG